MLFRNPWFTNGQHSGFVQLWSGVVFTTFKGGSHQVPQSRRPDALNFFNLKPIITRLSDKD